jgi:tetratricopeptide (TPR) repeat protein
MEAGLQMKKVIFAFWLILLTLAPNIALSKDLDPGFYFDRGNAHFNSGEYDDAIKAYTEAISLYPGLTDAYHNRGLSYYKKGKYEEAAADFSKVISRDPANVQAYNNRALAYLKLGQYENAINDYTKVISMTPDFADAYHNRGIAYSNAGRYDEAIRDYDKAISLRPKDKNFYLSRGVAFARKAMASIRLPATKKTPCLPAGCQNYELFFRHSRNSGSPRRCAGARIQSFQLLVDTRLRGYGSIFQQPAKVTVPVQESNYRS